jgi:hypothetical protein
MSCVCKMEYFFKILSIDHFAIYCDCNLLRLKETRDVNDANFF